MAFNLPVFNLNLGMYLPPNNPMTGPPDQLIDCQLYVDAKARVDITPGSPLDWVPPIYIRLSVDDFYVNLPPAVGAGFRYIDDNAQTWYYVVRWWERIHAGFPNQYMQLLCEQCKINRSTPDVGR